MSARVVSAVFAVITVSHVSPSGVAAYLPDDGRQTQTAAAPTRIAIPAIGVDVPVVVVPRTADSWDTSFLTQQAGHMAETAYPGQGSNVVIVAHRYLSYDATTMHPTNPGPFAALDQIGPGYRVEVYAGGSVYIYEVTEQTAVGSTDLWVVGPTESETLTLMTCTGWNHENATFEHILVVRARLVAITSEGEPAAEVGEELPSESPVIRLMRLSLMALVELRGRLGG